MNKDKQPEGTNAPENMKLEDAMRRLALVVEALDRENTDLEESLRLYREGVALVGLCNRRLEDARRTVEILRVSGEGELFAEPFAHEEA